MKQHNDRAWELLNSAYHMRKNIVFARHLLVSRSQNPEEKLTNTFRHLVNLLETANSKMLMLLLIQMNLQEMLYKRNPFQWYLSKIITRQYY